MATKATGMTEHSTATSCSFSLPEVIENPLLAPVNQFLDDRIGKMQEAYSQCMNETIDKVDKSLRKQLQDLDEFSDNALKRAKTFANTLPMANLRSQVQKGSPENIVINIQKYLHKSLFVTEKLYFGMIQWPKEMTDLVDNPIAIGMLFEKDKARIDSKEIEETFIKVKVFGNFPNASQANCKHSLTLSSKRLDTIKKYKDEFSKYPELKTSPLSVEVIPCEITTNMLSFRISDYYLQPGVNKLTLTCPLPQSSVGGYFSKQEEDTFVFEVTVKINTGFEEREQLIKEGNQLRTEGRKTMDQFRCILQ